MDSLGELKEKELKQKILGHDRLATTSIYLKFADEHVVLMNL